MKLRARLGGIELRVPRVARALRRALDRRLESGQLDERAVDLVHARLRSRSDYVRLARAGFERCQIRGSHILDEDVIARLVAVPIDAHRHAGEELSDENRDDAGFTVGVLARSVDVAVAQRGEIEVASFPKEAKIVLADHLRYTVRRAGILRRRLIDREVLRRPVDGPARCEDKLLRAGSRRMIENVEQSHDVYLCVVDWIARRNRHGVLRGVMVHDLGLEVGKNSANRFVPDVHMNQRNAVAHVRAPAAAVLPEGIDHEHVVTGRGICLDDVRSDEAGAAGDDNSQIAAFLSRRRTGSSQLKSDALVRASSLFDGGSTRDARACPAFLRAAGALRLRGRSGVCLRRARTVAAWASGAARHALRYRGAQCGAARRLAAHDRRAAHCAVRGDAIGFFERRGWFDGAYARAR